MKTNIKKAPAPFQEDLLYFQQFFADFCLCPKSVIITPLRVAGEFKIPVVNRINSRFTALLFLKWVLC